MRGRLGSEVVLLALGFEVGFADVFGRERGAVVVAALGVEAVEGLEGVGGETLGLDLDMALDIKDAKSMAAA